MKKFLTHRGLRAATLLAAAILLPGATVASAAMVDVDVVGDNRGSLPEYKIVPRGHYATHRAYVQALQGERYAIRVTNNTGDRVGLVIAVDGRNIVSGKKSNLRPDERMYILPPHGSGTFEGWRTERDTVNRFYFTDPGDSYAGAFGDFSATGVIAVAVFREKYAPRERVYERGIPERDERGYYDRPPEPLGKGEARDLRKPSAPAPGAAGAAPKAMAPRERGEEAGTGFGEERFSPARKVEFQPEPRVAERHFLKYEWRETLCKKGIIDCRWPKNRFWDDDQDDYAPYPPSRGREREE